MAKVFLRVYNREIEGMIEGGHLDEAVAHCQHILKTFPMHIETYRLLGKAFLEARRYTDAADIFQRTLMAVPDDFVSHVGMSIIRDDEGKLDDSIWHMERAFEVQPSNPAIQGELRRLYGRRDGVEPPKIRLSRDALANMYSQGELFNQAIAEIRSVLAEDPNRPDLQVMLARAYYRAGQKVEAAEMAATLLKKYIYCMDALRVLVDVLPGTAREENVQVYRQRLQLLDPYSSFTTDSAFASDQVADAVVSMERLEYKTGALPGSSQPDWASSLGIKLTGEKRAELPPGWMQTAETTGQPMAFAPEPSGPEAAPAAGGDSVPDWMRSAGWQESTGAAQDGSADSGKVPPAEPIAKADIPDWLKSMAPAETAEEADTESEEPLGPPSASGEGIPDWLMSGTPAEAAGTSTAAPEPAGETPPITSKPEPTPAETPSTEGRAIPDWLTDMGAGAAAGSAADALEQPPVEEMPARPVPSQPVDKKTTKPKASAAGADDTPFQPTGEVKPLNIEDDAFSWLESLAAKQGAKPEELLTKPQERSDEMPDWLHQSGEQPLESPVPPAQEPVRTPNDTLPLEPPRFAEASTSTPAHAIDEALPAEGTTQPVSGEDDTMAWLEQLAADQGTKSEEPLTKPEDSSGTTPALVQKGSEEQPAAPAKPEGDDVTITSWLNKLDVEEALGKASPGPASEAQPAASAEELPDWLKDLEKPAAPSEAPTAGEDLPEWLRHPSTPLASELSPEPEMPAGVDENVPVAGQAAPTTPEEWVPADVKPVAGPETTPTAEPVPHPVETSVQPPTPKMTGMLAPVPAQDKDAEFLSGAQTALDKNSLDEAMKQYTKLIKKGRLLDEVIHDLREAIYRYPVDVIVWQTLGDAYMRAKRLQDALDAYTKAEELLR